MIKNSALSGPIATIPIRQGGNRSARDGSSHWKVLARLFVRIWLRFFFRFWCRVADLHDRMPVILRSAAARRGRSLAADGRQGMSAEPTFVSETDSLLLLRRGEENGNGERMGIANRPPG
jgi:hypothetical protein